jgi:ubiquinone/menaquinone biosynthesis C-methylase UbiE
MAQNDTSFTGPVPEIYDRFLVPMLFQTYAEDVAARVAALRPAHVLETAAGSGVVTRVLAPLLAQDARYVVSDLNPPMLERAKSRQPQDARINWLAADALSLPFDDESFDAVLCQFGVMFFPDRPKGYAEARRVLKPGAPFIFNAWDSLVHNDVPRIVWEAVLEHYPQNPPDFFPRLPHGYHDADVIRDDLRQAGFSDVTVEVVTRQSFAPSARDAAVALCMGTPLRIEIAARDPDGLAAVTDRAEAALRSLFGEGGISGKTQALIAVARA